MLYLYGEDTALLSRGKHPLNMSIVGNEIGKERP